MHWRTCNKVLYGSVWYGVMRSKFSILAIDIKGDPSIDWSDGLILIWSNRAPWNLEPKFIRMPSLAMQRYFIVFIGSPRRRRNSTIYPRFIVAKNREISQKFREYQGCVVDITLSWDRKRMPHEAHHTRSWLKPSWSLGFDVPAIFSWYTAVN